jgi:hypothetical protein
MMGNQPDTQPRADDESSPTLTQLDPTQRLSQARKFGLFGD